MIELEIQPHKGIGPVRFGMFRDTVREPMQECGFPPSFSTDTLNWFAESVFQVGYEKGAVAFIGVSNDPFSRLYQEQGRFRHARGRHIYLVCG